MVSRLFEYTKANMSLDKGGKIGEISKKSITHIK
jgi:hypothetical protein